MSRLPSLAQHPGAVGWSPPATEARPVVRRAPRDALAGLAALLLASALIFARLGALPLVQPDEGRNAEVAREMGATGAWLVPTYDGLAYLDKPAFYFGAVAHSLATFGNTEWAARLPSALCAVTLLALLLAFCTRVYDARTAALAVLVVATAPLYMTFARLVILDMMLALFVSAAIMAGYLAEQHDGAARRRWYLAGAAAAALATLVKGPVGAILPTLVVLPAHWLAGRRGAARRFFAPANVLLWLAIVLPWFLGVAHQRPDFPYYGLVEESFRRFISPTFHRTAPVYYYVPVIAAVFFPWSVLLPEAVIAGWRAPARWTNADRLFAVWALAVVLFFSISRSKLPGYVLTAVVALGVLVARVLALALADRRGRAAAVVARGAAVLAIVCALGAAMLALVLREPGAVRQLLHLRGTEIAALTPMFGPMMWALAALALASAAAHWMRDARVAVAAMLLLPLSLLTTTFDGITAYASARSARVLAARLPALPAGTELACLQCFPVGLPFYLRRTVTVISRNGAELTSNYVVFTLAHTERWPDVVVPLDQRDRWLATRGHPVYLLARHRAALDSVVGSRGVPVAPLTPEWWGALLPPVAGGR